MVYHLVYGDFIIQITKNPYMLDGFDKPIDPNGFYYLDIKDKLLQDILVRGTLDDQKKWASDIRKKGNFAVCVTQSYASYASLANIDFDGPEINIHYYNNLNTNDNQDNLK